MRMVPRGWTVYLACMLVAWAFAAGAQTIPPEYQKVLDSLAKTGDYKDNVLKVNVPRNDLQVTIHGMPAPTPFGFGGWIAMTKGDHGMDVMTGDLVLTEDEVNPVISAILDNGLDVTALHNHFFWETPRIFYMHVHGQGTADDLARRAKPAIDLIGKVSSAPAAKPTAPAGSQTAGSRLDVARLSKIIGYAGEQTGPVYKITIGRSDFQMKEMGAVINARMGLNTWAAFAGTDQEAMVAGDIAMLEPEVTPVLKALRARGLDVVAIHHHMTATRPLVIFLHYWGHGPADTLADAVRGAIDQLGKAKATAAAR